MKNKLLIALFLIFTLVPTTFARTGDFVSLNESVVYPVDQVANMDGAKINVRLIDNEGDPVSGHTLRLISSSPYSEASARMTDERGNAWFSVFSAQEGTVTYSVYDVTDNMLLDTRARVLYLSSGEKLFVAPDPSAYFAAAGNSHGPIAKFEFEEVDEDIAPADSVNFTLVAYDALDQEVVDYEGEIRFSVDGENDIFAELPDDYTFQISDQGSHTFSLAMTFLQEGTYDVLVNDTLDPTIQGEYSFEVMGVATVSSSTIDITNPISGTYSNSVHVVTGTANPGASLILIDNDVEIDFIDADIDGNFTYTTLPLNDGDHKIYIAEVNEVGTVTDVSATVDLLIDSSAPEISKIEISPTGAVDPGTSINIQMYSTEALNSAKVVVAGNTYELIDSGQGFYGGSIAAPVEFGEYPLNFILTDQLGNDSTYETDSKISVGVFDSSAVVPDDVPGLVAVPGNGRVTLSWNAPASTNLIEQYRVFYGTSPNDLSFAVDTFSDATTWYVPNLVNNQAYYFGVAAIDDKGNFSENFITLEVSVPNDDLVDALPPEVIEGVAGADALNDLEGDVSETGPEMLWLVLFSLIAGYFYRKSRTRRSLISDKVYSVREDVIDCLFK